MKRKELLSLIEYFLNAEKGEVNLDEKFTHSNYYYLIDEEKASFLESNKVRLVNNLEFTPVKSGVSETKVGYTHFNATPEAKHLYVKRYDILNKRELIAKPEIERVSNEEITLRLVFDPPLKVGEVVKWKYSVLLKSYEIKEKDRFTLQAISPTYYLKAVIDLPRNIKRAEAFKSVLSPSSVVGKIPITETHNFLVHNNIIKLEIWNALLASYTIEWELEY